MPALLRVFHVGCVVLVCGDEVVMCVRTQSRAHHPCSFRLSFSSVLFHGCDWSGQGVASPIRVASGYYSGPDAPPALAQNQQFQTPCPIGAYCVDGVLYACPAGTFGNTTGLATSTCSGVCRAGYYCGSNSTSPTVAMCGSVSVYCPSGSGAPIPALPGEYTIGVSNTTMNATLPCPSGSYCVNGTVSPCPAGWCARWV